jgi:hypothetical protein
VFLFLKINAPFGSPQHFLTGDVSNLEHLAPGFGIQPDDPKTIRGRELGADVFLQLPHQVGRGAPGEQGALEANETGFLAPFDYPTAQARAADVVCDTVVHDE